MRFKNLVKVLIIFLIYFVYLKSTKNKIYNIKTYTTSKLITNDYFVKNENYQDCSPIDENYNQEYTIIDGVQYPKSVPIYLNYSINFECLNKNKIKRILFWSRFWNMFGKNIGERLPFEQRNCPVTNCDLTDDRNKLNESDLVLVHMWNKVDDPPAFRPPNQRWVFMLYESPIRTNRNLGKWNNIFNMTSTYLIDSDFPGYYESNAHFYWKENKAFNENFDFYGNRTKFAAAVSIISK